jgi:membrane-associated phospholipid phosphatase
MHKPSRSNQPPRAQTAQDRWLLVRGLHATIQHFADTWTQLPHGSGMAWGRTLAWGWLLNAALMLALVTICRALITDETALFQQVLALVPLSFNTAIWIETPGNSVFLLPITLIAVIIAVWWNAPLRALSLIAAFALIDTLVLLGWLVWDRPRPTLVYGGIAAPGFHAFPSGHVAQTVTVYGLLTYFWVVGTHHRLERCCAVVLCSVLISAVALARIRLGAHWPSDVLAGGLLGCGWLLALIWALRAGEARRSLRSTPRK